MPPRQFREDNGNDDDWEMTGQQDLEEFYERLLPVSEYELVCDLDKFLNLSKVCTAALCNAEYRGNIHLQRAVGQVLEEFFSEGLRQLKEQVASGGVQ